MQINIPERDAARDVLYLHQLKLFGDSDDAARCLAFNAEER